MPRYSFGFLNFFVLVAFGGVAYGEDSLNRLIDRFCVRCHGPRASEGDVNFEVLRGRNGYLRHRELWQAAADKIEAAEMPPEGKAPSDEQRRAMVRSIRHRLSSVKWTDVASPGDVPLPRLTSTEYGHTLRDAIGLHVPFDDLLPHNVEGASGFHTDRAAIGIGEIEIRSFQRAAHRAAGAAVNAVSPRPRQQFHFEAEAGRLQRYNPTRSVAKEYQKTSVVVFDRGIHLKDQRVFHVFDVARPGIYRIDVRAATTSTGRGALALCIDGREKGDAPGVVVTDSDFSIHTVYSYIDHGPHELAVEYDFLRVPWVGAPPKRAPRALPNDLFTQEEPEHLSQSIYRPLAIDDFDFRLIDKAKRVGIEELINEINRETIELYNGSYRPAVYYEHNHIPDWVGNPQSHLGRLDTAIDELAKLTATDSATIKQVWKSRLGQQFTETREKSDKLLKALEAYKKLHNQKYATVALDYISIEGPLTPRHDRGPGDTLAKAVRSNDTATLNNWLAQQILLMFRRKAEEREVERYRSFYEKRLKDDADHERAITETLTAILVSPKVTFRPEPVESNRRITADALHARLATFLWSSSPLSEAPSDLATSDAAIVSTVDRMIEDPRFDRFADEFGRQWLGLDRVGREVVPVWDMFRHFSPYLAEDMRRECALIIARVFREDLPLTELIDSDWTYLNERLANHYGFDDVSSEQFQLVKVDRTQAGGLLGTAGVLTATSSGVRPSAVQRGMLVASKLLGVRIPPPPPNAGALPEKAGTNTVRSVREELEAHRANPQCANCHRRIDPYGLALEGYDFVGRRRTLGPAGLVDTSAVTPDGTRLNGAADLKRHLVEDRRNDFVRAITKNVFAYAIGRPVDYRDESTITEIIQDLESNSLRARTLLRNVALSSAFRQRHAGFGRATSE